MVDVASSLRQLIDQKTAGVEMARFTVPEVGKIPIAVKRLFQEGCSIVIVFATVESEQREQMAIAYSKTLDVEIEFGKFAFFATVFDDEWDTQEELGKAVDAKLGEAVELGLTMLMQPGALAKMIGKRGKESAGSVTEEAAGKSLF